MDGRESPRRLMTSPGLERPEPGATNCASLQRDASPLNAEAASDKAKAKMRKPYTITKQRERWSDDEHRKFMEALRMYGRAWRKIEEHIGTKTAVQIRSHAQKFFSKMERRKEAGHHTATEDIMIPPPRPKKKPVRPYPRKDACESSENWETHTSQSNGHGSFMALNSFKSMFAQPFGNPGSLVPKPSITSAMGAVPEEEAEVTEATVAAVAAAASAAAAAAAAAVVAAAGQQVQAHLQAHPPHGFPFFGVVPPILAQLAKLQHKAQQGPKNLLEVQEAVHKSALVEALAAMQKDEDQQPSIEDYDADGTCTTDGTRMSASAHTQGCDGDSACSRELPEAEPAVVAFTWHSHRHNKQGDEVIARSAGSSWDVPSGRLPCAADGAWPGGLKGANGVKHPVAAWSSGQGVKPLQHYQGSSAPKPHGEVPPQQLSAFASHQPQRSSQQRTRRESSPEGRSASNGSGLPNRAATTAGSGWRRQSADGKEGPPSKRLKASPEASDNTPPHEPGSPSLQDMGRPSANTGTGTGTGSNETNGSNMQQGTLKCAPGSSRTNGAAPHMHLWTEAQASCPTLQGSGYGSNGHTSNGNGHTSNGNGHGHTSNGAGGSGNMHCNANGSNGNGAGLWQASNVEGGGGNTPGQGGGKANAKMSQGTLQVSNGNGSGNGSNGNGSNGNGSNGNGSNGNCAGGSSGGNGIGGNGNGGTYSSGVGYQAKDNGNSIKASTHGHHGNGNGYSSGNAVSWQPARQRLAAQHSGEMPHTIQGRELRVRSHGKSMGSSRSASLPPQEDLHMSAPTQEDPPTSCSEPDSPEAAAVSHEPCQVGTPHGGPHGPPRLHRVPSQIFNPLSIPPHGLALPTTSSLGAAPSLPLSAAPASELNALSIMVAALQAQASLGPFLPQIASATLPHIPTPPAPKPTPAQHPLPLLSGPATIASPALLPPTLAPSALQPQSTALLTPPVPLTNPLLLTPPTPLPSSSALLPLSPPALPLPLQPNGVLGAPLPPQALACMIPALSLAPEATLLARLVAAAPHGNPAAMAAMFPEALTAIMSVAQRHAPPPDEPAIPPAALRNDELHLQRSLLALSQLGAFTNLDVDLAKIAGGLADHPPEQAPLTIPAPGAALSNVVEHLSAFRKHTSM